MARLYGLPDDFPPQQHEDALLAQDEAASWLEILDAHLAVLHNLVRTLALARV
jgi:hypothetical protein